MICVEVCGVQYLQYLLSTFFSTFSMFSMSALKKSSLLNFSILKESLEMLSTCWLHSFRLVDLLIILVRWFLLSLFKNKCLSCRAAV